MGATTRSQDNLAKGARNLLINCANLKQGDTLLIIHENPELGWYDAATPATVTNEARLLGITPTVLEVGEPVNTRTADLTAAISGHDCTIFFARIGDQDRFANPVPGKKSVMCYARDAAMLASTYGRTSHLAFVDMKSAVNDILLDANQIEISCPLGTRVTGRATEAQRKQPLDVSTLRFPLGVPQPLSAAGFSGQVALAHYLTPTGSKVYQPAWLKLEQPIFARFEHGRIDGFYGDATEISRVEDHYNLVAGQFDIDADVVHSWHAGIHPGCAYTDDASRNPDRWSNTVFTNPRFLHFHTCGDYAPGEICWMVLDQTVSVDGKLLWEHGHLVPEAFSQTKQCIENWPELDELYANPSNLIGLATPA